LAKERSVANKRVVLILSEGFEELEALAPVDLLRRAKVACVLAAAGESLQVRGRNDVVVVADQSLDQALASGDFDGVIIPGGPGCFPLGEDQRVIELLQRQDQAKRLIGAICAAPLVLERAGLLANGRRFTGHQSIARDLPRLDPSSSVVIDGNLITSRGPGSATEFALSFVALLCGRDQAAQIAESIHFGTRPYPA
jgi:4-methyl-5(b-hydroxyethyl)-thiazole monophosphate biosynthesis